VVWNAGFRRMVGQLQLMDRERFKREHLQELAAPVTKDGIWLDVSVLFSLSTQMGDLGCSRIKFFS
jgi:hypothetical protein